MYLDATCEGLPSSKWEALMKGARRVSYRMLVSRVKSEIPELYRALAKPIQSVGGSMQADRHAFYPRAFGDRVFYPQIGCNDV